MIRHRRWRNVYFQRSDDVMTDDGDKYGSSTASGSFDNSEEDRSFKCSLFESEDEERNQIAPGGRSTTSKPSSPGRHRYCDRDGSSTGKMSPNSTEMSLLSGSWARRRHRRHRRRPSHNKVRSNVEATKSGEQGPSSNRRRARHRCFRHLQASSGGEWKGAQAPRNSNLFLIEDHGIETPSFLRSPVSEPVARTDSSMSEEDYYDSGSAEEGEFLERNFAQMYDQVHAESLSHLRHSDLVARCIELEEEVASLNERAREYKHTQAKNAEKDIIAQLRAENDSLKRDKAQLLEERRRNSYEFEPCELDS